MRKTLDTELMNVMSGETTPIFLATVCPDGQPNIVPVVSIEPWDNSTLIFGDLMIRKTKANLKEGARVGIGVMHTDGSSWSLRGKFLRFERTGEMFDRVSSHDMYRYNAYSGLRGVGIIEVEEVSGRRGVDIPSVALDALWVTVRRAVGGVALSKEGPMPERVAEKFSRMKAAKFLSWIDDDDYPVAYAAVSMAPVGLEQLTVAAHELGDNPPLPGARVAASVITFDPVAYQVKGRLEKYREYPGTKLARIELDEVYSASPPLPGQRIF